MARITLPVSPSHNNDAIKKMVLMLAAGNGNLEQDIISRITNAGFKIDDVKEVINAMVLRNEIVRGR